MVKTYTKHNWMIITAAIIPKVGKLHDNFISSDTAVTSICMHVCMYTHTHEVCIWMKNITAKVKEVHTLRWTNYAVMFGKFTFCLREKFRISILKILQLDDSSFIKKYFASWNIELKNILPQSISICNTHICNCFLLLCTYKSHLSNLE